LRLVIARQLHPLPRLVGQHLPDDLDHAGRVGTAVDQIADLDDSEGRGQRQGIGVRAERRQGPPEFFGVTADVTEHRDPTGKRRLGGDHAGSASHRGLDFVDPRA